MKNATNPRVIIVGAGFGGLFAARELAGKPIDVLLIDRNNFHTFTPLLYQVATCALDPSEIAYPVRSIFRKNRNVRFLRGSVTAIDEAARTVTVATTDQTRDEPYDFLLLATGSVPTYYGNTAISRYGLELRTLQDALALRHHVLAMFERAAWSTNPAEREALTTIVVVGGGPTGLETAGAIYELYNHVLNREYTHDNLKTRVVLVEMQPHLLDPYPVRLQEAARTQLSSLGVEVVLGNGVKAVTDEQVTLHDGRTIATHTLVWAAGVKASPVGAMLDVSLAHAGRLSVEPTMRVTGKQRIYAAGDMTYLEDDSGTPYPMVIPVAQQQGILAAKNMLADLAGRPAGTFQYNDRGMMATIGRRRAVAWIYNRVPMTGFLAWLAWLGLHLVTLLGFRNRVSVMFGWIWNYFTYDRSVRIIVDGDAPERRPAPTTNPSE